MSQSALIEKLRRELRLNIEHERQVVYILVETRKLIDRSGTKDKYGALYFYCSWAVHVELSWNEAQKIFRLFDDAHPLLAAGTERHELPLRLRREIDDITRLDHLQQNLEDFFEEHGLLPNNLLTSQWPAFMHFYTQVIQDCPLVLKASNGKPANIAKVVVTHELAHTLVDCGDWKEQMFKVNWTSYTKDGQSGTLFVINGFPVSQPPESLATD